MPLRTRVHNGTEVTDTPTTILTFGANLVEGGAKLWGFSLVNLSANRRKVTVHLVPSGDGPSESNCIFEELVIGNSSIFWSGPWWASSSSYVSVVGETGTADIAIRAMATEETV